MKKRTKDFKDGKKEAQVNPGYASFQIAKALVNSEQNDDPRVKKQACEKAKKWETVLENILSGKVDYGSRKPIKDVPVWATPEVVTGGFATGKLLAGGPLLAHEKDLLVKIKKSSGSEDRRFLNTHYLTEEGIAWLQERLMSGCYDINVPEEGALLVTAWLVENGFQEAAWDLLNIISPYFDRLRFYPAPLEEPRQFGSRVHLKNVGQTIKDLEKIRPNMRILAQKEAVEVWAPFYDRIVSLFLETVEDEWPCRTYPSDWKKRAEALLEEYSRLKNAHRLCGKHANSNGRFARLIGFLFKCTKNPKSLTGRDVGMLRVILTKFVEKRGLPDSAQCVSARQNQKRDVSKPLFHDLSKIVISRLTKYPENRGLDDVDHLKQAVSKNEESATAISEGTLIPDIIQKKTERCLNDTVTVLVERGLITSGETVARILPQMTSGIRAAGISDPILRELYASIYRAFRRRRSLLLLDLQTQIKIEELPWISCIDRFRGNKLSHRKTARQTLEEVTTLTLTSFPYAIIPNKLLQELRALSKGAGLDIPLLDELAADIFMGRFSGKFINAAKIAAGIMSNTLYSRYYGIDYSQIERLKEPKLQRKRMWFRREENMKEDPLALLCSSRAGVKLGTWDPAQNGMIIEQQQIITTQNLAVLFTKLNLKDSLRGQVVEMAKQCFRWICSRQQMKVEHHHAKLIMNKNTAYAWRQMIFYLSQLSDGKVSCFFEWAKEYLSKQSSLFKIRFSPILIGLMEIGGKHPVGCDTKIKSITEPFLGWSKGNHPLM